MAAPEPAGADVVYDNCDEEKPPHGATEAFLTHLLGFKEFIIEGAQFYYDNPVAVKDEVLSGMTISLLQVPESVAFSYVAGVHPLQGLYGSFWMCLTTSLLGGRPGMISGCAGALAVVIKEVMEDDGPFADDCADSRREYLFFTMVLTGILQLICGFMQCAQLVRLIPKTAFLGFFNGLAVVIFLSQLETFQYPVVQETVGTTSSTYDACPTVDFGFHEEMAWYSFEEATIWLMFLHVAIAMATIEILPRLPDIPMEHLVPEIGPVPPKRICPPSLVAILFCVAVEWWFFRGIFDVETPVVKDVSKIKGVFQDLHVPDVPWGEWDTWRKCFPIALSLCAVGLVESVLTLQAVDQILFEQTPVYKKNQECLAQGVGNLLSGLFQAMGGDAMIGQSTINVMNGAKGRLSSITAALTLLFHINIMSGFIEIVPTAALAGILFIVVMHTFCWPSIALILRRAVPTYMIITIIIVTILSVLTNLALGIAAGIVWESVCFVWREGFQLEVKPYEMLSLDKVKIKSYKVQGNMLFTNADEFTSFFTPGDDPDEVDLDLSNARLLDYSALYTLNVLGQAYKKKQKQLNIRMKKDDFEFYMNASDEPTDAGSAGDVVLRTMLKTKAAKAIEGCVTEHELELPLRYQSFLPRGGLIAHGRRSPDLLMRAPVTPFHSELPDRIPEEESGEERMEAQREAERKQRMAEFRDTPEGFHQPLHHPDHPLGVPQHLHHALRPQSGMSTMSEEEV